MCPWGRASLVFPTPILGFLFFLLRILPFKCIYSKATCQVKHSLLASFDSVIVLTPFSLFIVWCFAQSALFTVTNLRDRYLHHQPQTSPLQVDRGLLFQLATVCQSLGSGLKSFLFLSILNAAYFTCTKKFILNTSQLVFSLK